MHFLLLPLSFQLASMAFKCNRIVVVVFGVSTAEFHPNIQALRFNFESTKQQKLPLLNPHAWRLFIRMHRAGASTSASSSLALPLLNVDAFLPHTASECLGLASLLPLSNYIHICTPLIRGIRAGGKSYFIILWVAGVGIHLHSAPDPFVRVGKAHSPACPKP